MTSLLLIKSRAKFLKEDYSTFLIKDNLKVDETATEEHLRMIKVNRWFPSHELSWMTIELKKKNIEIFIDTPYDFWLEINVTPSPQVHIIAFFDTI